MESLVLEALLKGAAAQAGKRLAERLSSLDIVSTSGVSASVEDHLRFIASWSSELPRFGHEKRFDLPEASSALRISVPRRYQNSRTNTDELSEYEFIQSSQHLVVLGDPGAGKTTTLKRLCFGLLSGELQPDRAPPRLPLIFLLRESAYKGRILDQIDDLLGIQTGEEERESEKQTPLTPRAKILAAILDALNVVVFFDGLDEIDDSARREVEYGIIELSRYLDQTSLVISCRSGAYRRSLDGFDVFEIQPLNQDEIRQIASGEVDDIDLFLEALSRLPYSDVSNRPILLRFLIYLYNSGDSFSSKPSEVYRALSYRILKDWDEQRGIERTTSYSKFLIDRKIDLLSEFAYSITYKTKGIRFSDGDIIDFLEENGEFYDIAPEEFSEVCSEIEAHTGLIVAVGFSNYEFSHLSLQEFLAGYYISRSLEAKLIYTYLMEYPAPVAVACALSTQPDLLIATLFNRVLQIEIDAHESNRSLLETGRRELLDVVSFYKFDNLVIFLSRLYSEKPQYRGGRDLSNSLLYMLCMIYRRHSNGADNAIERLLSLSPFVSAARRLFLDGAAPMKICDFGEDAIVGNADEAFGQLVGDVADVRIREAATEVLPLLLAPKTLAVQLDLAVYDQWEVVGEKRMNKEAKRVAMANSA